MYTTRLLSREVLSGILFMLIGGGAALISTSYAMGTMAEMGPGFFPVCLGATIATIGLIITVRGWITESGAEQVDRGRLRPILTVLASIVVFGISVEPAGLLPALVGVIAVSRLSRIEGEIVDFVLTVIVIAAIPVAVFIYGLSLPISLWNL